MFASLAYYLLDVLECQEPLSPAAPVWFFTTVNKVIGTCDDPQERYYDSTIKKNKRIGQKYKELSEFIGDSFYSLANV